jgi:hypothetical protein
VGHLRIGARRQRMKLHGMMRGRGEHAVEHERVEVDVQVGYPAARAVPMPKDGYMVSPLPWEWLEAGRLRGATLVSGARVAHPGDARWP